MNLISSSCLLVLSLTILCLLINVGVDSQNLYPGPCPVPQTYYKYTIESKKLGGTWYQITYAAGGTVPRCMAFKVIPSDEYKDPDTDYWIDTAYLYENSGSGFQPQVAYTVSIENQSIACEPGKWKHYTIDSFGNQIGGVRDHWMLYLDYSRFGMYYSCSEDLVQGVYFGTINIFARGPYLANEDWQKVAQVLDANNIFVTLQSSYPLYVDQNNCPWDVISQNLEYAASQAPDLTPDANGSALTRGSSIVDALISNKTAPKIDWLETP